MTMTKEQAEALLAHYLIKRDVAAWADRDPTGEPQRVAQEARAALIAALTAGPGVPDGCVVVRENIYRSAVAIIKALANASVGGSGQILGYSGGVQEAREVADLLAAAPPAPVVSVAEAERNTVIDECLAALPPTAADPNESPSQRLRFDIIMECAKAIAAIRVRGQGGATPENGE